LRGLYALRPGSTSHHLSGAVHACSGDACRRCQANTWQQSQQWCPACSVVVRWYGMARGTWSERCVCGCWCDGVVPVGGVVAAHASGGALTKGDVACAGGGMSRAGQAGVLADAHLSGMHLSGMHAAYIRLHGSHLLLLPWLLPCLTSWAAAPPPPPPAAAAPHQAAPLHLLVSPPPAVPPSAAASRA
jgi:hypothetical protein